MRTQPHLVRYLRRGEEGEEGEERRGRRGEERLLMVLLGADTVGGGGRVPVRLLHDSHQSRRSRSGYLSWCQRDR